MGAIDVGFDVDMELLLARMKNLGANMRDLSRPGKEAAEVVREERNLRAPGSGHFDAAAYTRSNQKGAYIGLHNTGRGSNDYIGVVEFGGTIPVPHSRTNPKLKGRRRMASKKKPWIGGGAGSSYYLYPALAAKLKASTEKYREHVQHLCNKYMPK